MILYKKIIIEIKYLKQIKGKSLQKMLAIKVQIKVQFMEEAPLVKKKMKNKEIKI